MPLLLLLLCLGGSQWATAQSSLQASTYEQDILAYTIDPKAPLDEQQRRYAQRILDEIRSATKGKAENFNLTDYFNALSALCTLDEHPDRLSLAFEQFLKAEGSCEYVTAFEDKVATLEKYAPIRGQWELALQQCKEQAEVAFQPEVHPGKLTLTQRLLDDIQRRDQDNRTPQSISELQVQEAFDTENQNLIDELYAQHGTYLGAELVGAQREHIMWMVIQHSNATYMERYLPVLHEAYRNGQLNASMFKMTLDRYYGWTKGYQLFGTQGETDWDIADEPTRKRIMEQYGL